VLTAFLVDDEALALKRLARLIVATGLVEILGSSSDPVEAAKAIEAAQPDLLFLDIEMPEWNGFALLEKLVCQPLVIFTTAYSQYALEAFQVNSIAYLLKPVTAEQLTRALDKVEQIQRSDEPRERLRELVARLVTAVSRERGYPDRIASRVGERVEFLELSRVTHFFASDKLTFAATATKNHAVDYTIQELEQKLDPRRFVRIHRSTLVNTDYVHELHPLFAGRAVVRLKDEKRTELTAARDRVRILKERLGI
jgi:two-component system LytT family response regulator